MQLYNALSGRLEPFTAGGHGVGLYVCGITPYDTTHIGHCFTYAVFDVLVRRLELAGRRVRYVQNVTDIDDDLLRRARDVDDDWRQLGNRWTVHFIDDNRALNIRPPDVLPKASEAIRPIIASVEALLASGVAYAANGSVYYEIAADPGYGKLSRLNPAEMLPLANERGNNPADPNKRDPLDFVLWQAQAAGEPAWDSPWGPGRPGWHIECSTLARLHLEEPVDIHGGGLDLIYPHHESEIAQAETESGRGPFSRFWLHVAMVRYQGEKMSKSLGNLVMVRDLLAQGWPADAIRALMAGRHYRDSWNYEPADLEAAAGQAAALEAAVEVEPEEDGGRAGSGEVAAEAYRERFLAALDDDLNTPLALDTLLELAAAITTAAAGGGDIAAAQATMRELAAVLGLRLDRAGPEPEVVAGWQAHRRRFAEPQPDSPGRPRLMRAP
ncbi:MAG: cysteine--tRNA ligase [Candidatus Promineifilaceae bacterium]